MYVECEIVDGMVRIPESWLVSFAQRMSVVPDAVVFDLSDASPLVPAAVHLKHVASHIRGEHRD